LEAVKPGYLDRYCVNYNHTTEQGLTRILQSLHEEEPKFVERRPALDGYRYFKSLTRAILDSLLAQAQDAQARDDADRAADHESEEQYQVAFGITK
jgi:hypothetical protein